LDFEGLGFDRGGELAERLLSDVLPLPLLDGGFVVFEPGTSKGHQGPRSEDEHHHDESQHSQLPPAVCVHVASTSPCANESIAGGRGGCATFPPPRPAPRGWRPWLCTPYPTLPRASPSRSGQRLDGWTRELSGTLGTRPRAGPSGR